MKRPAADSASLCSLGRKSYASKSAIAALVNTFKRDGLPEFSSRTAQYKARKHQVNVVTPYGTLVRPLTLSLTSGKTHDAALQHPLAMLYHVSQVCPEFADLMRETMTQSPCDREHPWRIVIYQDGIDPSDGLSANHSRKSNIFYWSFLEFGPYALSNESNWFSIGFCRYNALTHADGGIAQLSLKCLLHFFGAEGCADIETDGAKLHLHGNDEHTTVFAIIGVLVADEPAIKEVLCCKGHAGTKQCVCCINAVAERAPGGAEGLHKFSEYAVSTATFDINAFKLHTDETIRLMVQKLNGMPPNEAAEKEPIYGFSRNPYSLITDHRIQLKVVSTLMWDWVHCYLCDGLYDVEFGLFMKHMNTNRTSTSYAELERYVEGWSIPKALPKVTKLLGEVPARNNLRKGAFTASASEVLTLVPVLLRYVSAVCMVRDECMPLVMSLLAVLRVVEQLQAVKTGVHDFAKLRDAIQHHLNVFKAAYGSEHCRPKHHYVLHLARCLMRFGTLLGTLVQERKHRLVLRYGRDRDNLKSWDLGCLEEITCHQIWEMSQNYRKTGIQESHPPTRATLSLLCELFSEATASNVRVASMCKARNGTIHVGDFAIFKTDTLRVGEVSMFVRVADNEFCVLSKWARVGGCSDFARYMFVEGASILIPVTALECPVTHRLSDDRRTTLAYMPFEYREHM